MVEVYVASIAATAAGIAAVKVTVVPETLYSVRC
jgi:hypothetical protein